jgi:hypothetical protein
VLRAPLATAGLAVAALAAALLPAAARGQAPPAQAPPPVSSRWALVVGSNFGSAGQAPLLFAETDAERFAELLVELGSVPPGQVQLLRSPTRAQLDAALGRLRAQVAAAPAGTHRTVVLFWSGHATAEAVQLGRSPLGFGELRAALDGTGAEVRLLFLDTCHAGSATRSKGAQRAPGFLLEPASIHDARGEVVITSSSADEASMESDEVGGSYFTHYLLSALRGAADASRDGEVTLEEAYRYVYHRTVAHTASTRAGAQHPGYDYDLSGSGDVVLTRLDRRGAALLWDEAQAGRFLVFDDENQRFLAEVQAIPGQPTRILVEAGRYRIQQRGSDALRETRLTLRDGDEARVDARTMRAVPYSEDATKGAVSRLRRRAMGREVTILGRGGAQAFFDPAIRRELIPPMPLLGFEWDVHGFAGPLLSLRVDALFGVREHDLDFGAGEIPMRFHEIHAGVGTFLAPRVPGAPALRPFLGLRAGLVWLHREFQPPLLQPAQDYLMVAPGIAGGLGLRIGPRLHLSLEARTHLMLYVDEGEQQALGYFEGIAGAGVAL